ncbi:hypothetical protein D3C79_895820 [compost metagenome]
MQRVGMDDAVHVGACAIQPAVKAIRWVGHAVAVQHVQVFVDDQQVGGRNLVEAQAKLLGVVGARLRRPCGDLPGQAGVVAAVEQDSAGQGEFLPRGVSVVGQRSQHLLLGMFDELVLGGLHGRGHGKYLHEKAVMTTWLAQRASQDTRRY